MWRLETSLDNPEYTVAHNAVFSTDGHPMYPNGDVPFVVPGDKRLISALWSDDERPGDRSFKRCEHYVFSGFNYSNLFGPIRTFVGSGYWWQWTNMAPARTLWDTMGTIPLLSGSPKGDWETLRYGGPQLYWSSKAVDRIADPPNLGGLISVAYKKALPKIKKEMDLVNSLRELKDFKSLPKHVSKLCNTLGGLFKGPDSFKAVVKTKLLKETADSWLQWKFNLQPLVSDVKAVWTSLSAVKEEYERLLSRSGKVMVTHVKLPLRDIYRDEHIQGVYRYQEGNLEDLYGHDVNIAYSKETCFTLTLKYTYTIEKLEGPYGKLAALMDKYGVNFDPTIVWNAIPWSFVVDWVFHVNELLSQFAATNVKLDTHIIDACWSVKVDRIATANVSLNSHHSLARQVHEKAYKRVPCVSNLSGMGLRVSGLNATQWSLAAALGISQRSGR